MPIRLSGVSKKERAPISFYSKKQFLTAIAEADTLFEESCFKRTDSPYVNTAKIDDTLKYYSNKDASGTADTQIRSPACNHNISTCSICIKDQQSTGNQLGRDLENSGPQWNTDIHKTGHKNNVAIQSITKDITVPQKIKRSNGSPKVLKMVLSSRVSKPPEFVLDIPPPTMTTSSRIRDLIIQLAYHAQTRVPVPENKQDRDVLEVDSGIRVPSENGKAPKIYKCSECNMSYVRKIFLFKHVLSQHSKETYCLKCTEIFTTEQDYNIHMLNCHSRYMCEICGAPYPTNYELERHTDTHRTQEDSKFKCGLQDCSFSHKHYPYFVSHIKKHRKENPFCCRKCGKKMCSRYIFNRHAKECIRNFCKCPKCDREFPNINMLYEHKATCHVYKTLICAECDEVFERRTSLSKHFRENHSYIFNLQK